MALDFEKRVAIVTGAGRGMGRAHALALARHGVRVLVNDLGCDVNGQGEDAATAQAVVDEIVAAGGEALADTADITNAQQAQAAVQRAVDAWGRVDIVLNNAGYLRDRSFANSNAEDFRDLLDVHVLGAYHITHAAWPHMVAQSYGRVIFTISSTGLFGHYGQSAYGAAKMALVGLMQTLGLEGERHGIRVNCLSPSAHSRMTQTIIPDEVLQTLQPEAVVPAMLVLAHAQAPSRAIVCAGAGTFELVQMALTPGVFLGGEADAALKLQQQLPLWQQPPQGMLLPQSAEGQVTNEVWLALAGR